MSVSHSSSSRASPEPLENLLDPRHRRRWVEEKNARVFTLVSHDSPLQVDVFLDDQIPYDTLKSHASFLRIDDFDVLVSSKDDLIAAKRSIEPLRRIDQRDIEDLEELIDRERT